MNDIAIRNYCIWARNELIAGVEARMRLYGVAEGAEPAGAAAVGGRALSPEETGWRDALLRAGAEEGFDHLRDRAAYTWFNRIAAVRYMEVHDFLPGRVRMFTRPAADGSWELGSQAADEALDVEIEGADPMCIAELKQAGEDGPLFRYLFLAQCAELSGCMPGVFQPVDECMALLLPANLMDADGVIGRMVGDIDEADWEDVQILGWMYQYYNSEVKDAFFASKAKETPDTIGPATQLFTPDWIVRYMVQNSLGRLWMLNNPGSPLRDEMEYYIEPDETHEDFIKIGGPEDISLCDPACGSGHILVYAFELLAKMYLERGYREREIPGLVLSKNLHGMEIDPRAAQIARLALAMCARGLDRRFFGRGVQADIAVLAPVALGEGDVPQGSALEKRKDLLDALAHLDEAGSLLAPGEGDLAAIREAIELTGSDGLFGSSSRERLQRALSTCETLARRHDCVVANPPYMGSSSFGPFMSKWVKKSYPDVKSDLCTCFIERGFNLAKDRGYAAMITMQSWMFLGSFEKMRSSLIEGKSILSMLHLGPRAFDAIGGEVVNVTADVVYNGQAALEGAYMRLVDTNGSEAKCQKALEAIQNPDCGWFYRRDAETFKQIPGTPIAYWASDHLIRSFVVGKRLDSIATPRQGLATSDNNRFLRKWWEVEPGHTDRSCSDRDSAKKSGRRWFPIIRGGSYRKWWGEYDEVVNWYDDGREMKEAILAKYTYLSKPDFVIKNQNDYFKPAVSWSKISSGLASFRFAPQGMLFEVAGACLFAEPDELRYIQAFCNCSIAEIDLAFMSPTLNFEVGQIGQLPVIQDECAEPTVCALVEAVRAISKDDYDSFETSWDFKRHPLL
ncbi:BREX-1 system adenine-specific DNA-methyltransferase PglX [Collinsella sp. LCP19S3_B7]|uniref:BREX-1 system adenine-specific DNA-methyltransferase PglX n=1 Tax=Collinsella sp. LCP19S3_B7 TaxID=3438756 RepID=UPI003F92428A